MIVELRKSISGGMDICKIPTTEDQPLPSQNKGMKRPSDQEYKRNDKKLYTGWALNPLIYATVYI